MIFLVLLFIIICICVCIYIYCHGRLFVELEFLKRWPSFGSLIYMCTVYVKCNVYLCKVIEKFYNFYFRY